MAGKHKPIQPFEVSSLWKECIQWDVERKYDKAGGHFKVQVECPMCGRLHWVKESSIRTGVAKTPRCRWCNARKPLTIDEVPEHWKPIVLWDKERGRTGDGKWAVWVECPECKEQRLFSETRLRMGDVGSGRCKSCAASMSGPDSTSWEGGRRINKAGYVDVNIHRYSGRELEIAKQMCNCKDVVREHRLVVAMHLDRPLTSEEIVHHKDSNRANNAIENLKLLTRAKHYKGHGDVYYQKWQEALGLLRRVYDDIEDEETKLKIDSVLKG